MSSPRSWPFRPWVCVERSGEPESLHEGLLAVVDDEGNVRAQWGDHSWVSYLRSSLKMIQALPLVESGAADALALTPRHLAVCCASHSGEDYHLELVRDVLARAGLTPQVLRCGPHFPYHEPSRDSIIRDSAAPAPIHNNCSGKHAGMLATCAHRAWDTGGYEQREHPLQQEIAEILANLSGVDPDTIPHGIDGCGVPTFRLPVVRYAHALARFTAGSGPGKRHRTASRRIFDAMSANPDVVGGTGRFCTVVSRAANRPLLAKAGGEGLYAASWHEGGRAVALFAKAASGDTRSRDFAVTEVLHQLGVLDSEGLRDLSPFHSGPIRNHGGTAIGRMISLMDFSRV